MKKKSRQITFKASDELYQELAKRVTGDLSESLVARDILEMTLRNGASATSPEAPELARAIWVVISALSQHLDSEQAAELVRCRFLDGRNAPEFKQ